MEILPVVDKKDKVIGQATREECHKYRLRHRAIHVFVFKGNKILLQKRSSEKDVYPGFYEASVSGHVLKGETYERAAIRELKEEIGIEASRQELQAKDKIEIQFGPEHEFVQIFMLKTDSAIKLKDGEVEKYEWATEKELLKEIKTQEKKFTPEFLAAFEKIVLQK